MARVATAQNVFGKSVHTRDEQTLSGSDSSNEMSPTQQHERLPGTSEEEPLLGERGDASQVEGKPLYYNFILGMSYTS